MGNALKDYRALDRFYDHLAYKPWCGFDKISRNIKPKSSAVKYPYISPNQPTKTSWLVFDIDHSDFWIWYDNGLPEPNIVVQNPSNGHAHLYYAISPVCISDKARVSPIRYMEAVRRGLTQALKADPSYTGRIAKNPYSDAWRVTEFHTHEYSLDELANEVTPISKPFRAEAIDEDSLGRNCTLFNKLRFWAYQAVNSYKKDHTETQWHDYVLNQALEISTIEVDFTYNEIKNTAKSVAKFTWSKYTGTATNKGIMQLDHEIDVKTKQKLAAERTHTLRTNTTSLKITSAIQQLRSQGHKATITRIADIVGISRQQISRRYKHLLNAQTELNNVVDIKEVNSVTYAVHQITACFPAVAAVDILSELGGFTRTNIHYISNLFKQDEGD